MENKAVEYLNYIIPDLAWKDLDSLIFNVGSGELSRIVKVNTGVKFCQITL